MDIYLGLFNLLLNECKEPLNFDLPLQWIWDIINGFLRHHESFLLWRSEVKKRSPKERQLLRDSDNLWTVELVLNALNTLIRFSNINEQLEAYHKTRDPEAAKEVITCLSIYCTYIGGILRYTDRQEVSTGDNLSIGISDTSVCSRC